MANKILVTGASGFIGSFIVEEALRQGMEVWAAMRRSSSREYLRDRRIHFIELNLSWQEALESQLQGHQFDYVVHAAGITKSAHRDDFARVNTEGTKNLVRAIARLDMPIKRFVYISSLSVFGAIHETQPYQEIADSDTPRPNTAYGLSKLEAERFLDTLNTDANPEGLKRPFPYIILRPTGVYGPRERDYFLMAQSISRHVDFSVGYRRQDITFVFVLDVVQAVMLSLEHGRVGGKYFLSDGQVYQSATFSDFIIRELGSPWCLRIKAPLWVLRIVTWAGDRLGRMTGHMSALNNDKYHILKQRNWRCDIGPARKELGYEPRYMLSEGTRLTIGWYKENHWLK